MSLPLDPGMFPHRVNVFRLPPRSQDASGGTAKGTPYLSAAGVACSIQDRGDEMDPMLLAAGAVTTLAKVSFPEDLNLGVGDRLEDLAPDGRVRRTLVVVRYVRRGFPDLPVYRADCTARS